jgi:hypothetical protein
MISLDALLVFIAAASLPVIYVLLLRRWLEPESRQSQPEKRVDPAHHCKLVKQHV